jgi:hypothetical protein
LTPIRKNLYADTDTLDLSMYSNPRSPYIDPPISSRRIILTNQNHPSPLKESPIILQNLNLNQSQNFTPTRSQKKPQVIRVENISEHDSNAYKQPVPSFTMVDQGRLFNNSYNEMISSNHSNPVRDSSSFMMPLDTTPVREGPLV